MAGVCVWQGGMHGKGGMHDRGHAWQGVCMAGPMHSKRACVVGETATARILLECILVSSL